MILTKDGQQNFQCGGVKYKRLNVASPWEHQQAINLVMRKKQNTNRPPKPCLSLMDIFEEKRAQQLQETGTTERTWMCCRESRVRDTVSQPASSPRRLAQTQSASQNDRLNATMPSDSRSIKACQHTFRRLRKKKASLCGTTIDFMLKKKVQSRTQVSPII
jgi:hypothetical protein